MTNQVFRRDLLGAGTVTLALAVIGCRRDRDRDRNAEANISPVEDLMREHGMLERLMVVYEAAATRLDAGDRAVLDPVRAAARIAREFVEDYHERIEEQYVFPRFQRANRLADLVAVLRTQHDAGRKLTDRIQTLSLGRLDAETDRAALAAALRGYAIMFHPHIGREDTVLFPAFRELVGKDYDELGDKFEDEERRRFGPRGFERYVAQLPAIEAAAGVADLARFTATTESAQR
jgi:hemerythrin-like domain-containing protein